MGCTASTTSIDALGISRSVLADRLARLVELGVVRAVPYKEPVLAPATSTA